MLINGKEIKRDEKQSVAIQRAINQIDDLGPDLKSEIPPEIDKDVDFGFNEFSLFGKEDKNEADRKTRYEYFDEMVTSEFISRALEVVSDDSTQKNEDGEVLQIYSDDENIKDNLENLFTERLDMNNDLWNTVYETCKKGDNFYEVIPDNYKKPKKIIFLRYLEPNKVERIEKDGKLAYFLYNTYSSPLDSFTDMAKTQKDREELTYKLQPWQIVHFKIENKEFSPYGKSLLNSGLKTYRRLNLLEDVMLVYRIARASEKRIFYIDVGNLNKIEARRFLEKIKNSYRTQSFIDEDGEINKKAKFLSIMSDIFIPVREGTQGTRIESLPGGEALHNIDDMKYFRDKILKTMNVPSSYLGDEADRSRGSLCLHPDTKIKLADGRSISIKEIADEYTNGKTNYVYSVNERTLDWEINKILFAGKTRLNASLVKVTLDNNKIVICTPDHKFMLRGGTYCEAKDLIFGTSLMPIYTKISSRDNGNRLDGYEMLLNNKDGKWKYTHRIAKANDILLIENSKKNTVHHIDFNKRNNNPCNLTLMKNKEHWALHVGALKERWLDQEYRKKMCKRGFTEECEIINTIKEYDNDSILFISKKLNMNEKTLRLIVQDFGYKNWIDFVKKNFGIYKSYKGFKYIDKNEIINSCSGPNERLENVSNKMNIGVYKILETIYKEGFKNWFDFVTLENDSKYINQVDANDSTKSAAKKMNCSVATLRKKIKTLGYKDWDDFIKIRNHKVISVEYLNEKVDTYDITVENTSNFALDAGCIVHNSNQDIHFSRFIERVQSQIIKGINKVAALELFFSGYKKDDLKEFYIEMTPPSNIKEIIDIDLINQKMQLVASILQLEIFPVEWILKNIMKMSEREISDIMLYKKLEGARQAQAGGTGGEIAGIPGTEGEVPPGGEAVPGEAVPGEAVPGTEGTPPETTAPEELAASVLVNLFGKEVLAENPKDFFNLIEIVKNRQSTKESFLIETMQKLFKSKRERKLKEQTNNTIRKMFLINEFGGLEFENGKPRSMQLFERVENKDKEIDYITNTVLLG